MLKQIEYRFNGELRQWVGLGIVMTILAIAIGYLAVVNRTWIGAAVFGMLWLIGFLLSGAYGHLTLLAVVPALFLSPTLVTSLPPPLSELRLSDLLISIMVVRWILDSRSWTRHQRRLNRPARLLVVSFVAVVGSTLLSSAYAAFRFGIPFGWRDLLVLLAPLQWVLYLYIVYVWFRQHGHRMGQFHKVFLVTTFVVTAVGLLQFFDVLGIRQFLDTFYPKLNLDVTQFAVSSLRITSTLDGNPNILAAFLTFALALILTNSIGSQEPRRRWPSYFVLGLSIIALVMTGSRAQLLASLAVFIYVAMVSRLRLLLIVGLSVWMYLQFAPDVYLERWSQIQIDPVMGDLAVTGGVQTRFNKIEDLWPVIQRSPIFGVGPSGAFGSTSDNFYLRTLLDTGFLGLILSLIQLGIIVYGAWQARQKALAPWQRMLASGLIAFVIAVLVGNLGARVLNLPRVGEAFWVVSALTFAAIPDDDAVEG